MSAAEEINHKWLTRQAEIMRRKTPQEVQEMVEAPWCAVSAELIKSAASQGPKVGK